jgi:UDP-glucose 4-epimerase
MAKVWVLGGEGFIGRAVCRRLSEDGHDVLSCTASSRRHDEAHSTARHPRTRLVQTDGYRDLSPGQGDICVHLAESNIAAQALGSKSSTIQANGTYPDPGDLMNAIESAGFAHVVYASSAVVYGDSLSQMHFESEVLDPRTLYAERKRANELRLLRFGRGTVLRLANTYGAGMSSANVLSEIIEQAESGDSIVVNDLTPVRDYVHVEDVARAFSAAVSRRPGGIFNVSTGTGTSVAELAALILRAMGCSGIPVMSRRQLDSVKSGDKTGQSSIVVLSNVKAAEILNWKPDVSLEEGITRLVGRRG